MLLAAALVPASPMLVPAVAAGAAGDLDAMREAAQDALRWLATCGADRLVLLAADPALTAVTRWAPGAAPDLTGLGVTLPGPAAGLTTPPAGGALPLALSVGAWLLGSVGLAVPEAVGLPPALAPEECAALGRELAADAARVGMVVVGDGSARRSVAAPGYLDARAAGFDERLVAALAAGDAPGLAALEPDRAAALLVGGRAAWQVLAGAAGPQPVHGRVDAVGAPHGVGLVVARWSAAAPVPAEPSAR